MSKGPDAFRTISEVAEELDLPQHVLRFWETRFTQIKPMKRGGGRRYYRPDDVELLRGIRRLLYGEGYTIKGVQRILKEQGLRHVAAFAKDGRLDPVPADVVAEDDEPIFEAPQGKDERSPRPGTPDRASVRAERREPVFETRPAQPRPADRAPPAVKASPEPTPNVSNFPAAPPDEPDDFETYLPPLIAASPPPPDRGGVSVPEEDPFRPPRAEQRRDPKLQVPQAAVAESHSVAASSHGSGIAPAGLPREDRELLQATLAELLECKRLLDQSR
ncbi:MerR family transcriptional regulator [Kaistia algarum]|uniref:MerR family transcriptional regulator n=1 Tax=Kaistia algarum TaxID=2083279 RepID=UPI0022501794|nr:MerR family transcriptional regulator [Kaistia algarum]MCX5514967.1 MerR family transcriptional regulator [Kaistia algarum]